MAGSDSATLPASTRTPEGSRSTRRLRRAGQVPGVIYGGDREAQAITVDARTLRNAIAHSGAVIEVEIDGGQSTPVIVKDVQRHPIRGEAIHIDLLRVDMKVAIHATVTLELLGADEAPGVKEGGVLTQELRELNIEALPGDIPDVIQHDVSGAELNATIHVSEVTAPRGVTLLDDAEGVVASITPPSAEPVDEVLEVETERVGEAGDVAQGQAAGDTADEAAQSAGDSGDAA